LREFKTLYTTFYSYKGGVGRTSSLVNSALLRAISGDRVVVLDFDFEAPGVSAYVKELARNNKKEIDLDARPGVLEYLCDAINSDEIPSLKGWAITNKELGLDIDGEIWFIGAGKTSESRYSHKFSSLNWSEIFEKNQGELILRNLKKQINAEFNGPDHVFIDSRTGISEIGGVCTRYLADSVVVLSSLNDQNLFGTSRIFETFKKSKLHTILVASNVPVGLPWGKGQLFSDRIAAFKKVFHRLPDLLIYYYPSLSLMEYLPSYFKIEQDESVLKDDPLLNSYDTLSDKIDAENPNSFNKFMGEFINKLFFLDSDEKNRTEEYFNYFRKHYSHRVELLKIFETTRFLKKACHLGGDELVENKKTIKGMKLLASQKEKYIETNVDILISFTMDQVSDEIVTYYRKNPGRITNNLGWLDVLGNSSWLDAVELLVSKGKLEGLVKKLPVKNDIPYAKFAQGFIFEKLGDEKKSIKHYKSFIDCYHAPISEIEAAGTVFALAYAKEKIGDIGGAVLAIKRAQEIVDSDVNESTFLFIPALFKRVDDPKVFQRELSKYKNRLVKRAELA
jgi:cellulose biosynthesis protein BcsQ